MPDDNLRANIVLQPREDEARRYAVDVYDGDHLLADVPIAAPTEDEAVTAARQALAILRRPDGGRRVVRTVTE
jgi:hypothetical protein